MDDNYTTTPIVLHSSVFDRCDTISPIMEVPIAPDGSWRNQFLNKMDFVFLKIMSQMFVQ